MNIDIYRAIYHVAAALEVPVIVAELLALAWVVAEIGAFLREIFVRRRRRSGASGVDALTVAAVAARAALGDDDRQQAAQALASMSWSAAMDVTRRALVEHADVEAAVAKDLADFDFNRQRRLGRTRMLVRIGPALGLMGTLIPLAPALDGLSRGNVAALTENLRVAFSVTVVGILVGAVAFGITLVRERMYGQDYSDLEYVAALLTAPTDAPT